MCGEVDGEGQNCYYSYQVCKNSSGGIWRRWVGKQITLTCPPAPWYAECTVPLCDNVGRPEEPPRDTCKEDTTGTQTLPKPDLSGVGIVNGSGSNVVEGVTGKYCDKGVRKDNEE